MAEFAFVYSLTKDNRRTSGGETLIWREIDYFGEFLHQRQAGQNLYQQIEPRFNRLLIFDDRLPHAVQAVEGVMDPCEGRIVLHGHIYEGELAVEGHTGGRGLECETEFRNVVVTEIEQFSASLGASLMLFHGPVVFRTHCWGERDRDQSRISSRSPEAPQRRGTRQGASLS